MTTVHHDLPAAILAAINAAEANWRNPLASTVSGHPMWLAWILRGLDEDRAVFARHDPHYPSHGGSPWCRWCGQIRDWPCAEVRSLARRYMVEVPS